MLSCFSLGFIAADDETVFLYFLVLYSLVSGDYNQVVRCHLDSLLVGFSLTFNVQNGMSFNLFAWKEAWFKSLLSCCWPFTNRFWYCSILYAFMKAIKLINKKMKVLLKLKMPYTFTSYQYIFNYFVTRSKACWAILFLGKREVTCEL